jgi:hypothetical protein
MVRDNPLLVIGFVLVVIGAVLPFVMVIGLVESTFLFGFISFFSSTIGIFLGVLGTAMFVGRKRRSDSYRNWRDGTQE